MSLVRCVALVVVLSSPAEGQRQPALDTIGLSDYVASMGRAGQLPDVAVVVVGPEGPVFQTRFSTGGSGAGPGARGRPDAEDRFSLGAVSEMLTAFAVMRLVDDGLIDLDTPVVRYLPDLAFSDAVRTGRLTIRHLLDHRSGLPRIGFYSRRVQVLGRLEHVDFVREPGIAFEASSLDHLVLGRVLEAVSGQPYAVHMTERLFEPIEMRSVSADGETARREGVVEGHRYLFGWPVSTQGQAYTGDVVPAAHLAASASDLGRFLAVLLNQGRRDDTRLLSASSVLSLLPRGAARPGTTVPAGVDNVWKSIRGAEIQAWYRAGVSPGFHALVGVLPRQRLGIVVLASRAGGPGPNAASALLSGVVDRVLGRPRQTYLPWERILHLVLLILVIGSILQPLRSHHRWKAIGQPRALAHTPLILGRLALEVAIAAALPLVVILGVAKMSIIELFAIHPDLALAVIVFPLAAVPTSVWRALVHSEIWRRNRNSAVHAVTGGGSSSRTTRSP